MIDNNEFDDDVLTAIMSLDQDRNCSKNGDSASSNITIDLEHVSNAWFIISLARNFTMNCLVWTFFTRLIILAKINNASAQQKQKGKIF